MSIFFSLTTLILACLSAWYWRQIKLAKESLEQAQVEIDNLQFDKKLLIRGQDMALLVIDEQGVICLVNKFSNRFFHNNSLEGEAYSEVLCVPEVLQIVDEAIRQKKDIKRDLVVVLDSEEYLIGEERSLLVNVKLIEEAGQKYWRVYIYDNTEQYRVDQVRKDFVANASHELRTPLAIINGYVETLMDEEVLEDTETSIHFLGIMKKHGARITRIIEEMLLISKLESGVSNMLNLTAFRVRDCIDDCLLHLDPLIKERKASVVVKMNEPNLTIQADRFYWNQILFNLVENAIKQNSEDGLKIKIGCSLSKKTGGVKIWVSDGGIGIPSSDLPFIFRRFYRVEKHHSQQDVKGTGLGLSIVKRAVESHNGTITCDSIQNQFTRFSIELPSSIRTDDLSKVGK